jgi:alanine dehydrogenase
MFSYPAQIARAVAYADVLIGAVLIPGSKAPHLVSEKMAANMKPGALIIDVSIDQGGCVETSRPTTLREPIFVKHKIIHYCVPNFTALTARTASRALSNVVRPYILKLAESPRNLITDAELRSALMIHKGKIINPRVAMAHQMEVGGIEES